MTSWIQQRAPSRKLPTFPELFQAQRVSPASVPLVPAPTLSAPSLPATSPSTPSLPASLSNPVIHPHQGVAVSVFDSSLSTLLAHYPP